MLTLASKRVAAVIGLGLCLTVAGCESGPGLTRANYNRIETDGSMTKEDVDKLLGSQGHPYRGTTGEQIASGFERVGKAFGQTPKVIGMVRGGKGQEFRWGDDYKYVICTVENGKVVEKRQRGM
jgi:hypothetical protein